MMYIAIGDKTLTLPATRKRLDEWMRTSAPENKPTTIRYLCEEAGIDAWMRYGESFDELNFLALRLSYLYPEDLMAYRDIVETKNVDEISIEYLINLSYSLDKCLRFQANGDADVGTELINRVIPVPGEARDYIDAPALGKKHREIHGGQFKNGWYFEAPTKLNEVYHSEEPTERKKFPDLLEDIQYPIELCLRNDKRERTGLKLPFQEQELEVVLEWLGVKSIDECDMMINTTIRDLPAVYVSAAEIEQLNELAEKVDDLDDEQWILYNAVLEWELDDIPTIADYLNYLDNLCFYRLNDTIQTEEAMAIHLMNLEGYELSEELYAYMDFDGFIKDMQDKHPSYLALPGLISRDVPKEELIITHKPPEEDDSFVMQ